MASSPAPRYRKSSSGGWFDRIRALTWAEGGGRRAEGGGRRAKVGRLARVEEGVSAPLPKGLA